jgi:hypothetical protein
MSYGKFLPCIPRSAELSLAVALLYGTCSISLSLVRPLESNYARTPSSHLRADAAHAGQQDAAEHVQV